MATTAFATGDASTNKLWSGRLFYESISPTWYGKLIGESDNSPIQLKTETSRKAGDQVTVTLRGLLTGRGKTEGQTLEGNEEALTTTTFSLVVNELRHAVKVKNKGSIDQQRVLFNLRTEAKDALRDWFEDRFERAIINQLASNTVETDTAYTGLNAVAAPTSGYQLWPAGLTNDQSVTTVATHDLTLADIDRCVATAKTLTRKIRPVNVNGKKMYICLLHPGHIQRLRTQTSAGQWMDIQLASMSGGDFADNPIVQGGVGIYNNVIFYECERLPYGIHSSTGAAVTTCRRAVFLGAQSAVMGFGQGYGTGDQMMDWIEDEFDYKKHFGVAVETMYGVKKTRFDLNGTTTDFGAIVLSGYSAF